MSHKKITIEALHRTLKDIKNNQGIMGRMVVLLAGDFRQTLPVIARGTPADEINACLKASVLRTHVKKVSLSTNMRVLLHNDCQAGQYAAALLKIGEDRMPTDSESMITLSSELCQILDSTYNLKNSVYPDLRANIEVILAPTNEIVGRINDQIMSSHKLRLKVGVPVMLMRNLDPPRLCNGTRLQVTYLGRNVINYSDTRETRHNSKTITARSHRTGWGFKR